jgi:hypothetical protein
VTKAKAILDREHDYAEGKATLSAGGSIDGEEKQSSDNQRKRNSHTESAIA